MFQTYYAEDPKNRQGRRNINNTHKALYNCGGYALDTYSWYTPFEGEICIDEDFTKRQEKESVAKILKDFPELKRVSKNKVLNKKIDYKRYVIIAFRYSDYDFHFWKLGKNGQWYDKMGSSRYIKHHNYHEVFNAWGNYNKELYFFIKQR